MPLSPPIPGELLGIPRGDQEARLARPAPTEPITLGKAQAEFKQGLAASRDETDESDESAKQPTDLS